MNREEIAIKMWNDYNDGSSYLATSGLSEKIPKYIEYYEGKQFKKSSEETATLPKVSLNITSFFSDNKESNILAKPYKIVYKSDSLDANKLKAFNDFANYQQHQLGQEELDSEAVSNGVHEGTGAIHYFFNADKKGKLGKTNGQLEGEVIDCLSIIVPDPNQTDIQKQKWVMIVSREDIDSLKTKCDKEVDLDTITFNESDSPYKEIEFDKKSKTTVLTRYFRQNGEVYVEKSIKNVLIAQAKPITPDFDGAYRQILEVQKKDKIDAPDNDLPDTEEKTTYNHAKATLYPIVLYWFKKRKKCIYGIGEIESIINIQNAVNNNISLAEYSHQKSSLGKLIVHPDNVKENLSPLKHTLIDKSRTMGGYKNLDGNELRNPTSLTDYLINAARMVEGTTQVTTGEVIGANMSGSAIARLQEQAEASMSKARKNFKSFKKRQGEILAQFFKIFYKNEEYTYLSEEGEGKQQKGNFSSSEYSDVDFDVIAETVVGTLSSTAGDIAMLETLLNVKAISPEDFINNYPSDAISNKDSLKKAVKEGTQVRINQLETTIQQQQQALEQSAKTLESIQTIVQQNNSLKDVIAKQQEQIVKLEQQMQNLTNEAIAKINLANEQIMASNKVIDELKGDATAFATELYKNRTEKRKNGKENK